ncbi:MAG: endonuclease MutS2 [Acidobacteriota bacterium]
MQNSIQTLEFDQLKGLLLQRIRTPLGASLVEDLNILDRPDLIERELRRTSEGVAYLRQGTALDLHDLPDPRPALAKLNVADINLEPFEILNLLRTISVATGLRETFHDELARFPLFGEITEPLPNLRPLYQRLRGRISPTGDVEDFASAELREVRFQMARLRTQIHKSLESILKRADEAHALQDEFITIRNDRYVIPIRNDNRGAVTGVVHGMSSSGQTAFIEPLETINQNNELVRLRELEQAEIVKVLFKITGELREERDAILAMGEAIGLIDLISARARLAIDQDALEPRINSEGRFILREARHPLLEESLRRSGGRVVPITFEMDAARRVMVVSGPNAGGKTVVLKTAGLLSMMAQAGLHVPATEADLPVFRQVLTDIGDQQSIAANLSTFTAHIQNIRAISDHLEPPALILLDEVGTGTDPEEGSALAVAMVDYFRSRGAHIIVTTHYSGLKVYATNTSGVINASVEFDERTLKPTYRLLTGLAGASSGIEIARRFGLPAGITELAARKVLTASAEAAEYLRRLKEQFDENLQNLAALEEERAAVAAKYARLENDFAKRDREREREFREELRKVVDDFTVRAERLTAQIEDAAEQRRLKREVERRTVELKTQASTVAREMHQKYVAPAADETTPVAAEPVGEPLPPPRELRVGDRVRLLALDREGLVESVGQHEVVVQVGALRFREKPADLLLLNPNVPTAREQKLSVGLPKGVSVSLNESKSVPGSELNVIGQTVDAAVHAADKFLDAAWLDNYDRLRIVHGVGMGALKRAIADLLASHPHVSKFYPADPGEGGQGATIVELKK